jgi:hypothetical protein
MTRGRESVEVRLRGQKKKVGAGYYVNIQDLAIRNHKLSELHCDLRVRVESQAAMLIWQPLANQKDLG